MKTNNTAYVAFIVVFLGILLFPHFSAFRGRGPDDASVEQRSMTPKPGITLALDSFPDYAAQFDRYYRDSFGFRDKMIRWNNLLILSVFHESPSPSVRVGRDGWLFYAGEADLEDYENILAYTPQQLAGIAEIIEDRRAWLEQRGIKFYCIVAPEKHTIYGEYLPPELHKIGKESRFDQIARRLGSNPRMAFIDPRPAMLLAKSQGRLYHRTDTHWNELGAFFGYTELVNRIAKDFPAIKRHTLRDYTISKTETKGGDLARMLSLTDVIKEENITLVPKFRPRAIDAARPYDDPGNPAINPGREMIVKETRDPSLPRALIFRDSYSTALVSFLSENFQSIVFLWTWNFMPELIEREKPDIVIEEHVERYIDALSLENPPSVRAGLAAAHNP